MPRQKSKPVQKKRGRVESNNDGDNNNSGKLLDYDFDEIVEEDDSDDDDNDVDAHRGKSKKARTDGDGDADEIKIFEKHRFFDCKMVRIDNKIHNQDTVYIGYHFIRCEELQSNTSSSSSSSSSSLPPYELYVSLSPNFLILKSSNAIYTAQYSSWLLRDLKNAVENDSMRIKIITNNSIGVQSKYSFSILIGLQKNQINSCFVSSKLLKWCLTCVENKPPWWDNNADISKFEADEFIKKFDAINSNQYNDKQVKELSKMLSKIGLKTELRQYQLEGILYMKDRLLNEKAIPMSESSVNGYMGWLPIKTLPLDRQQSRSVWFSLIKEEVIFEAPNLVVLPRSGILADDMGTGKTIAILSLIMLLRKIDPDNRHSEYMIIDEEKGEALKVPLHPKSYSCMYYDCPANKKSSKKKDCSRFVEHPYVPRDNNNEPIHFCLECIKNWRVARESEKESMGLILADSDNEELCSMCSNIPEELFLCNSCPRSYCIQCIKSIFTEDEYHEFMINDDDDDWNCMSCKNKLGQEIVDISDYEILKNEDNSNHADVGVRNQDIMDLHRYVCACGRSNSNKNDGGWIQCTTCQHYLHVRCANFKDLREAEKCKNTFECLACSCFRFYKNPLPCKTTLLIMPGTLISQWQEEIRKHFDGSIAKISIVVYHDITKIYDSTCSSKNVSPKSLAAYDIIIMDLVTLKSEFHLSRIFPSDRSKVLEPKCYNGYFPPPLLCLNFRTIVIDETQRIEGEGESQMLTMSSSLEAVYRVSVSGTPLGSGRISDIKSLCKFLRIDPFDEKENWNACILQKKLPVSNEAVIEWIYSLFRPVVLRRTKKMIQDQLNLYSQVKSTTTLTFSKFEMSLYEEHKNKIMNSTYEKKDIEELRKCCCHPAIFDKIIATNKQGNKLGVRSFGDIMIAKIEQLKVDCEELQREFFTHLAGAAGLSLLSATVADSNVNGEHDGYDASYYLQRALQIYVFVSNTIADQRQTCRLLSLVKLEGDNFFTTKIRDATSTSDPLLWKWEFESNNNETSNSNITDWGELNDAFPSTPSNSQEINITTLHSSIKSHISGKMILNNPRRLRSISITTDFKKITDSNDKPCMVLFPRKVRVTADNGNLTSVLSHSLPMPELNHPDLTFSTESAKFIGSSYRVKSWQIAIDSVHSVGLMLVKKDNELKGSWANVKDANCNKILSLELDWDEAKVDVDILQELHNCVNVEYTINEMKNHGYHDDTICKLIATSDKHIRSFEPDAEFISASSSSSSSSSRADIEQGKQLKKQIVDKVKSLETDFLKQLYARQDSAYYDFQGCKESIDKLLALIVSHSKGERQWWGALLEVAGLDEELKKAMLDKIDNNEMAYKAVPIPYINGAHQYATIVGAYIKKLVNDFERDRVRLLGSLSHLENKPSDAQIHESSNCSKCRDYRGKSGPVCKHCQLGARLLEYRNYLHSFKKVTVRLKQLHSTHKDDEDQFTESLHNESEVDGCLQMVIRVFKEMASKFKKGPILEAASDEIKRLDKMKEEYIKMTRLWGRYDELLKSYDEIAQSKVRLQLANPDIGDYDPNNNINHYPYALSQEYTSAYTKAVITQTSFQNAITTLKNHKTNESEARKERKSKEIASYCTICLGDFDLSDKDEPITFLKTCLHRYHTTCIKRWYSDSRTKNRKTRCPLCNVEFKSSHFTEYANVEDQRGDDSARTTQMSVEVGDDSARTTQMSVEVGDTQKVIRNKRMFNLKGDMGSKIDEIAKDLYELIHDPKCEDEKAIVFSQWPEMIELVAEKLKVNSMKYAIAKKGSYKKAIESFKRSSDLRILLMPLKLGAEGLNLIVANHIFFLEPLVDTSMEEQALNRCHRIGQEKIVKIYKYIIEGTIEENIVKLALKNNQNSPNKSSPSKKKGKAGSDQNDLSITDLKYLLSSEL